MRSSALSGGVGVGAGAGEVPVLAVTTEDAAPVLPAASVAFAVRLCEPVRKRAGGIAPRAAAVGCRRTDLGRAVIHLHDAVRFRGARQVQAAVGVGRRRCDRRGGWRNGVDPDDQRCAGVDRCGRRAGAAGRLALNVTAVGLRSFSRTGNVTIKAGQKDIVRDVAARRAALEIDIVRAAVKPVICDVDVGRVPTS